MILKNNQRKLVVGCGKLGAAQSKGFGLLEVLISIAILVMVSGAAIALQISSTRGSINVKQDVVAYNLAQEAIEQVRQQRDSNWIDQNPQTSWSSGFAAKSEQITINNVTFTQNISFNPTPPVTGDSVEVIATVSWSEQNRTRNIKVETVLTNWQSL